MVVELRAGLGLCDEELLPLEVFRDMSMRVTFLPFVLPDMDEAELFQIKEALKSDWAA